MRDKTDDQQLETSSNVESEYHSDKIINTKHIYIIIQNQEFENMEVNRTVVRIVPKNKKCRKIVFSLKITINLNKAANFNTQFN